MFYKIYYPKHVLYMYFVKRHTELNEYIIYHTCFHLCQNHNRNISFLLTKLFSYANWLTLYPPKAPNPLHPPPPPPHTHIKQKCVIIGLITNVRRKTVVQETQRLMYFICFLAPNTLISLSFSSVYTGTVWSLMMKTLRAADKVWSFGWIRRNIARVVNVGR